MQKFNWTLYNITHVSQWKHILLRFQEWMKGWKWNEQEYQMELMYLSSEQKKYWKVEVQWMIFVRQISALQCIISGHDVYLDGWCTPDSGGENWECRRCGAGGQIKYY